MTTLATWIGYAVMAGAGVLAASGLWWRIADVVFRQYADTKEFYALLLRYKREQREKAELSRATDELERSRRFMGRDE